MKTNFSVRSLLLFFAVIFTTLPVLLFGTLQLFEELRAGNTRALDMNQRSARLIQQEISGSLDQYRTLIEGMSLDMDLATLRPRNPASLKKLLAEYTKVLGVVILNPEMISVATYSLTMEIRTGIDYSDRPQVIQARTSKRTAISGNLQGRAVNIAAVVIVVPLLDEHDDVAGFFAASIPPTQLATSADLRPAEYGAVVDSYGRIVVANTGQTGITLPQLESMATGLAGVPDGTHRFRMGSDDVDVQILSIEPIGWKVVVGVAPEFLQARTREAIRQTALLALFCAAIGVVVMSAVSLSTARGMADVGHQVERMSAVTLKPIAVPRTRFLPTELSGLIANFNNLLERRAKASLAELEAISRVSDAIFITTGDGTLTYVNQAGVRMFGEVSGHNLREFIEPQAAGVILAEGRPRDWKGDVPVHRLDAASFDGFLSSTPILDNGQVTSIVVIIQDITKEKAARESQAQSEKMITLGELVAGTSHELNNPLAIVTGYSDLLLEEEGLTPEQRSKIESIRKNALRASSVVHSLLAFARKRKPQRVRTDINRVVEAAAELKEYDLKTSGVAFEKILAADLPAVYADPNQIQQVLLNVINNAQDAVLLNPRGSRIALSTEAQGDMVLIRLEDNGPGISKSDLKKVFDPFFTTKPVGKGTGLGLSISYGIIREHNGAISIHSEVGEGTRVIVELPVDTREFESSARLAAAVPLLRAMRILVVDDETDIVAILRKGLTRPGVTVDSAVTIADALLLAGAIAYDFVLTDVKMPGGSGIDLYRQLCKLDRSYSRRIVFLTGDTSNPNTVQFLEEEGLAYFSKPFDFQAMDLYLKQRVAALDA